MPCKYSALAPNCHPPAGSAAPPTCPLRTPRHTDTASTPRSRSPCANGDRRQNHTHTHTPAARCPRRSPDESEPACRPLILQQPRVTRPRKTRQRAVRVPDVVLGGVSRRVHHLVQPARAVNRVCATMRQMVKVLKVFRNFQTPPSAKMLYCSQSIKFVLDLSRHFCGGRREIFEKIFWRRWCFALTPCPSPDAAGEGRLVPSSRVGKGAEGLGEPMVPLHSTCVVCYPKHASHGTKM